MVVFSSLLYSSISLQLCFHIVLCSLLFIAMAIAQENPLKILENIGLEKIHLCFDG